MIILALVGVFFISYYGCQAFMNWQRITREQLERQASEDIEMQKVITEVKTKIIKFEPRRKQ